MKTLLKPVSDYKKDVSSILCIIEWQVILCQKQLWTGIGMKMIQRMIWITIHAKSALV